MAVLRLQAGCCGVRDRDLDHDYVNKTNTRQALELPSAEPLVPANMWDQLFLCGVHV